MRGLLVLGVAMLGAAVVVGAGCRAGMGRRPCPRRQLRRLAGEGSRCPVRQLAAGRDPAIPGFVLICIWANSAIRM